MEFIVYMTPIRDCKSSGATAAQWSYCLARLECGLAKGKHIDEVFGSKTALVWLVRSGNADQLGNRNAHDGLRRLCKVSRR